VQAALSEEERIEEERIMDEARARVGSTLRGKWTLEALLGMGGMASVYAARHRNGMRGAVKLLLPVHAANTALKARFLREGYLANKVAHPGVVRVLDDDTTDDGGAFLVMELLEGESLVERATRWGGALSAREVMAVAAEVLDVLAAAHDVGIVHRDIKPENLFVTHEGMVKVLDFGLARAFEGESMMASATQTGFTMGTPAYMSPEQARARWSLVDEQSDLWSVGATMFALVSGRHVHEEETMTEQVAAIFLKPARSLASVAPEAPAQLVKIIDRALELKKADRWGNAREMREAVIRGYEELWGPLLVVPPPAPSDVASAASVAPRASVHSVKLAFTQSSSGPPPARLSDHLTMSAPSTPSTAPMRSRRGLFVAIAGGVIVAIVAVVFALHSRALSVATLPPPGPPPTATSASAPTASPGPTATATPTVTATAIVNATATASARPTRTVPAAPPRAAPAPAHSESMFDRRY
jgi:serine/threonine-protein kinase